MQLIENVSTQKLRGAYYTPPAIASFILRWGLNGSPNADVLEPSCGDGVFLERMAAEKMDCRHVVAIEFVEVEAEKARAIGLRNATVTHMDFHRFCLNTKQQFDLVVGNPPFIRYQYYPEDQQTLATAIFKKAGLKRSKLTNAWVTFIIGSCLLLRETGKLGFVVPSELLQVSYTKQLRQYLGRFFNKITVISFENLVFKKIQQEVVLLLCERNGTNEHLIEHVEVKDLDALSRIDPRRMNVPSKQINFLADKWNFYFLDGDEIDFLCRVRRADMPMIRDYASVEVGITTGSNVFFTVPQGIVNLYGLQTCARPMVGRSVQVSSICFTTDDWRRNRDSEARTNLLVFPPNAATEGTAGVRAYIENGEKLGINKGYKTGIRDDWYVIPSVKLSEALFLRRNNIYPKFVLNEAHAYTTDTMHRVFILEGINAKALIASYYNSLSFSFAEIAGRSFGGGVLELMPSEVEEIFLPYRVENEMLFPLLDRMVREKKTADEILDVADDWVLRRGMGFSSREVQLARSIWHKLSGRRLNRGSVDKSSRSPCTMNAGQGLGQISAQNQTVTYPVRREKPEQLHLAIEKRKKYGGGAKPTRGKARVKALSSAEKPAKKTKSVKAKFAKHG